MKPRVILVNKFYYRRGGDCISLLNTEKLLRQQGHEVAVFAMTHPSNLPSPWSRYWPEEVTFQGGPGKQLAAASRLMGLGDVASRFRKLVKDFRPDVVHLHNVHSYLSPVVGQIAADAGAKVVWTLHDYKLICPAYTCMRNSSPCEECFTDKSGVIHNKCMKGSRAASLIACAEAWRWNRRRLESFTSRFICPSAFMAEKMRQGGFSENRLSVLHNFITDEDAEMFRQLSSPAVTENETKPYYCYAGRLTEEKGVRTLLEAASRLPYELRIAGTGPLERELQELYGHRPNTKFLGHLGHRETATLLAGARLSIIPSKWYENNPLSVIESLCAGTPVVGSDIGGIPELINSDSGLTFSPGSSQRLQEAIERAWSAPFNRQAIALGASHRFSAAAHYRELMFIYGHNCPKSDSVN